MFTIHKYRLRILALVLLASVFPVILLACAGSKSVEPYQVWEVYIPQNGMKPSHRLVDRSDPEDVLKFAAGLVSNQQYDDAAEQYMNLARGIYGSAPDGETVYLLSMEAARLYFIAGKAASTPQEAVNMINGLSACTEMARDAINISERVISKEEAVLLYLGDMAAGRSSQKYWAKVPHQLVKWMGSAQSQIGG